MQRGIFSQLVVVPLFKQHRILSQVAGHGINVVKGLPPLVLSEEDVEEFAGALDSVIAEAQRLPRAFGRFSVQAARAGLRAR
jgi:ornithine--oxo-acid transaminase